LNAGFAAGPTRRRRRAIIALLAAACAATGCAGEPTAFTPPCADTDILLAGSPLASALGPGDRRRGGAYIDYYAIYPAGPSTATVQLTATSFDPFLILFDETGLALDQAFDPDPGTGVRTVVLTWYMDQRCYLVGASSWEADATGGYLLSLQWTDPDA
jgi:hypothetical protein